jgi:AraC-like DNA-binding protein
MQVALGLLRDEHITAAEAADRGGYGSEAAFSRAFKRTIGFSPGSARSQEPEPVLPAWTT